MITEPKFDFTPSPRRKPRRTQRSAQDLYRAGLFLVNSFQEDIRDPKYRAVVLTKIAIRDGDNTDVLMMLGLIPTPVAVTEKSRLACPSCAETFPRNNPGALALGRHTKFAHAAVTK